MKKYIFTEKGQTLGEVIIALALFAAIIGATSYLISSKFNSLNRHQDFDQANAIARAGFEAIESIARQDWSSLVYGAYGLSNSNGAWQLKSAPDFFDKYARTITVSEVRRDADCKIVQTGGIVDPDAKMATVAITWPAGESNSTKSYNQLFTAWQNPTSCLTKNGDVRYLLIDVGNSIIDSTKKSLVGTILKNTGPAPVAIDTMALTWTKPGNITYIKINGANYWHSTSGIGSPAGVQPSGTVIDIENFALLPGVSYDIDVFRFDSKVDGSTFTITATMTDGSSTTETTTPPFIP